MGKYIIVHDLGTTANKACLFDESCSLVASVLLPYPTYFPTAEEAVQRPEEWWRTVCASTKELLNKAGIMQEEISVIGFSGHSPSMVPVDDRGRVLLDKVPIYSDMRASEQVKNVIERIGGYKEFYGITGAGQLPEQYSLFKMVWFMENHPDKYKNTYKFLNTVDYLVHRLTGRFCTDYSQAGNVGALEIRSRVWSDRILQAAGIEESLLPEVVGSAEVVGEISSEASRDIGLPPGTPVVIGGGDVACAAAGAGAIREGTFYVSLGSAAWMGVFSEKPGFDVATRLVNFCHLLPGSYALHYFMTGAGICYQWVRDNIYQREETGGAHANLGDYEMMDKAAEPVGPGAGKLLFLPYMRGIWAGEGCCPNARGVLFGLNLANKRADIYRAAMEGIGFGLREIMEYFTHLGYEADEIRVIGGGTKSSLWRQIIADICGKKVLRPRLMQEAGALGAAVAAGIGVGLFKDFGVLDDLIKIESISLPNQEKHAIYCQYYELFLEIKEKVLPIFDKLAKI
ncbi:MAG: xylulokinase [Firmicutes bacterium]|nr:xylulokinase [Bacillota bacterium]